MSVGSITAPHATTPIKPTPNAGATTTQPAASATNSTTAQPAPAAAGSAAPAKTLDPAALQKAAIARFQRTGVDKDAAAGDPDHDAPASKRLGARPAAQAVASAVPTVNAAATGPTATSAAAAAAYTAKG